MKVEIKNLNGTPWRPKFMHIRSDFDLTLSKKKTNQGEIDHSYGGITVAYWAFSLPHGNTPTMCDILVQAGFAVCSGLDRYEKKIGNETALKFLRGDYIAAPARRKTIHLGVGISRDFGIRGDLIELSRGFDDEMFISDLRFLSILEDSFIQHACNHIL